MSNNKNSQKKQETSSKNHDHSECNHDHESHEHAHDHCEHQHTDKGSHEHTHDHTHCENQHHNHSGQAHQLRYEFSGEELKKFELCSFEVLMQQADDYLTSEEYGKVVPIFEVALAKLSAQKLNDQEYVEDLMSLKQNLAFSYGIIGEHKNAVPLWKNVIQHKESSESDCSDLLDDYFGIALSCEQCGMEDDFLVFIQKGLKLSKENKFDEYTASFEHELGGFYCDHKDFERSESHLKTAILIREKLEDIVGLAMSKMYMGILFEEQDKLNEAKQFYEKALELTKYDDYREELIQEREELEQRLSQIQNVNLKSKLLSL